MRLVSILCLAFLWASGFCRAEEDVVAPDLDPLNTLGPPAKAKDGLPAAEVVEIPVKAPALKDTSKKEAKSSPSNPANVTKGNQAPSMPQPLPRAPVPGFKSLLSGELEQDLTLGPEHSPVLVRGACVVPAGLTLTLKPGTVLQLQADPNAQPAERPGQPDPSKAGQLWIVGKLVAEGQPGKPVVIAGANASGDSQSGIFFYGGERSELDGLRLTDVAVTQSGPGEVIWTTCELVHARHYALAAGAAVFLHTSMRGCGGIYAAYAGGPWALMAMRCSFDQCREGLVIGSDPGDECLIFRNNSLTGTKGANLRAAPINAGKRDARGRLVPAELLIGENWYGSAEQEILDAKVVDVRSDSKLPMRLNTRPPAALPYPHVGANVPPETLAKSLKELEPIRARLLAAYEKKRATKP